MAKYHINDKGEVGICKAKIQCQFMPTKDHYSSKEEAYQALEKQLNEKHQEVKLSKTKSNNFSETTDKFGITFSSPPIAGCYLDEDSRGFRWWRLEHQEEFFEDERLAPEESFSGYKIPKYLNTIQENVSPLIIAEKLKNNTSKEGSIILIRKNKSYWIFDGNHRMIALQQLKKATFDGIVIDVSDDGESFEVVTPEDFNQDLTI